MAGIDISVEVTSSQLEALAGGELLKAEVGMCGCVRVYVWSSPTMCVYTDVYALEEGGIRDDL